MSLHRFDYYRRPSVAMLSTPVRELAGLQMNYSDILVALNLETGGFEVLECAAAISSLSPVKITLLYVVELNVVPFERRIYDEVCLEYQQKLQALTEGSFETEPRLCVRIGKAHEQILAEARESQVQLILLGMPKEGKLRWLFGPPTVERVLREAPCLALVLSESWKTAVQRLATKQLDHSLVQAGRN